MRSLLAHGDAVMDAVFLFCFSAVKDTDESAADTKNENWLKVECKVQKHFLWTMVEPDSSCSFSEVIICWKVLREETR